jgi:hypothetical protein
VRTASAGDHLVNAYLRLAYEANAALAHEVRRCGFQPEELRDPRWWADVDGVSRGLDQIDASTGVIAPALPSFELTHHFRAYAATAAVVQARAFRDVIIHRERPSYREAPGLGRVTAWREGEISFQHPPSEEELTALPTLDERRALVSEAIAETHEFAERIWDLALRFLRSVHVSIVRAGDQVSITTTHRIGPQDPMRQLPIPRENRDPSAFLR